MEEEASDKLKVALRVVVDNVLVAHVTVHPGRPEDVIQKKKEDVCHFVKTASLTSEHIRG